MFRFSDGTAWKMFIKENGNNTLFFYMTHAVINFYILFETKKIHLNNVNGTKKLIFEKSGSM